jgi:hypothetical protein
VASSKTTKRGRFNLGFRNRPNPNAILYVVASQGSAGVGKHKAINNNAAIKLMSVIVPPFPKNGNLVAVNELTTLAAAYDLSNFFSNQATPVILSTIQLIFSRLLFKRCPDWPISKREEWVR